MICSYCLCADATLEIGSGHVMRMMALGQMLQDKGQVVHFVTKTSDNNILKRLREEGFIIHVLDSGIRKDLNKDSESLIRIAQDIQAKWVILDGYHFDTDYQKTIKDNGFSLMCVDDMAEGHFGADIVLNQNITATQDMYSAENYTKFLIGPKNVLLRREFIQKGIGYKRNVKESVTNILVTMGGADPDNITRKILEAIDQIDEYSFSITVVIGALNLHYENIVRISRKMRHSVEVLRNVTDAMPDLMKKADLGIFSGGSSVFEGLYLQLPLLCCLTADNQKLNRSFLNKKINVLQARLLDVLQLSIKTCLLKDIEVCPFNVDVLL